MTSRYLLGISIRNLETIRVRRDLRGCSVPTSTPSFTSRMKRQVQRGVEISRVPVLLVNESRSQISGRHSASALPEMPTHVSPADQDFAAVKGMEVPLILHHLPFLCPDGTPLADLDFYPRETAPSTAGQTIGRLRQKHLVPNKGAVDANQKIRPQG